MSGFKPGRIYQNLALPFGENEGGTLTIPDESGPFSWHKRIPISITPPRLPYSDQELQAMDD